MFSITNVLPVKNIISIFCTRQMIIKTKSLWTKVRLLSMTIKTQTKFIPRRVPQNLLRCRSSPRIKTFFLSKLTAKINKNASNSRKDVRVLYAPASQSSLVSKKILTNYSIKLLRRMWRQNSLVSNTVALSSQSCGTKLWYR